MTLPQRELGVSYIATFIAIALCLLFLDTQHRREFLFHSIPRSKLTGYKGRVFN
jgi:hypothetical protein